MVIEELSNHLQTLQETVYVYDFLSINVIQLASIISAMGFAVALLFLIVVETKERYDYVFAGLTVALWVIFIASVVVPINNLSQEQQNALAETNSIVPEVDTETVTRVTEYNDFVSKLEKRIDLLKDIEDDYLISKKEK